MNGIEVVLPRPCRTCEDCTEGPKKSWQQHSPFSLASLTDSQTLPSMGARPWCYPLEAFQFTGAPMRRPFCSQSIRSTASSRPAFIRWPRGTDFGITGQTGMWEASPIGGGNSEREAFLISAVFHARARAPLSMKMLAIDGRLRRRAAMPSSA